MAEYLIPQDLGESEVVEKRSRFLGALRPVSSEAEARAYIESIKKRHYDARHNCWCYRLESGVERYSDDGEPQGTAGQPMLNVFQREAVTDVVCVVTRYFGGILLGAGGLVRAYTQSAKDALDAAGVSAVRRWTELAVDCPYNFLERVKLACAAQGGMVEDVQYAAAVTVRVLLPAGGAEAFRAQIIELSAGGMEAVELGEVLKPAPVEG